MSIFTNNPVSGNADGVALNHTLERASEELRSFVTATIVSGNSYEIERVVRYQLNWNFYNGKHWRVHNDSFISFNYVKAFINKVNSFLLGPKGFSVTVVSNNDEETPEEIEKAAEAFLNYRWKKNKKVQKQYEILQMGSVSGDVWVHLQYKDDPMLGMQIIDTGEVDEAQSPILKKVPKQRLFIDCLDSRHCFPEFDRGDMTNLVAFTLRQPLGANKDKYLVFCTRYTGEQIITWYQKDTVHDPNDTTPYERQAYENPYGFIPVVHIKNKPHSDGYFGVSDCIDIIKLNKVYNETSQTVKGVIDYYTEPVTVVTGGTIKQLTKGLGRVWSGLPSEANVFNLGLGEDLNAANQFLDRIKAGMHELSDVPENALGRLQAISNTSAAALQITYQPLMQQADTKGITYGEGFAEMHHFMFKMAKIMEPDDPLLGKLMEIDGEFEDNYVCTVDYNYGLPNDRTIELQNAQVEISAGLNSRKRIMNRLGERNVPALMDEIDQEKIRDASVEKQVQDIIGPVEPPPNNP